MTDAPMISDEARQVVAGAIFTSTKGITHGRFDELAPEVQEIILKMADAALTAALPFIAEQCAIRAECHFDDRGGRDRNFDWHDGYRDGTQGAAAAIRAAGGKS